MCAHVFRCVCARNWVCAYGEAEGTTAPGAPYGEQPPPGHSVTLPSPQRRQQVETPPRTLTETLSLTCSPCANSRSYTT